jgi:hypothetical protein
MGLIVKRSAWLQKIVILHHFYLYRFLILFVWCGATACNDPASSDLRLVLELRTLRAQSNACAHIFSLKMESSSSGSCLPGEWFSLAHEFLMHVVRSKFDLGNLNLSHKLAETLWEDLICDCRSLCLNL